jgi:hypothetical protein
MDDGIAGERVGRAAEAQPVDRLERREARAGRRRNRRF